MKADSRKVKAPKYLVCVDERPESRVALRLAAHKAAARGGTVSIIHVITPPEFQPLQGVAERMESEQRAKAEALMQQLAEEANSMCGVMPSVALRMGAAIGEQIIAATAEDPNATMLVLGVAEDSAKRGTLAAWLASQLGKTLLIPMLMVPGNLTDRQLAGLI